MISFVEALLSVIRHPYLLAIIIGMSFAIKNYFITILVTNGLRAASARAPCIFLIGVLAGSLFGDIAWLIKLCYEVSGYPSYKTVIFFIRIAWGFLIVQYQALAYFIQTIADRKHEPHPANNMLAVISSLIASYFFYLAIIGTDDVTKQAREAAQACIDGHQSLEFFVMRHTAIYILNLLILPGLYTTFKKIRSQELPKILRNQLKVFLQYLICPYLFSEFLLGGTMIFQTPADQLYPIVGVSTLLLAYATYYCLRRIMGMRFLNLARHMHPPRKAGTINDFKNALEQLGHITNMQELKHIVQGFFKDVFRTPFRSTLFYLRTTSSNTESPESIILDETSTVVERFLSHADFKKIMLSYKILIYDDIAFSEFYKESAESKWMIQFLESIDAEVFIPILARDKLTAYIIICKDARPHDCYHEIERDEMVVFADYLGNIINILRDSSIESLIEGEKQLKEDIYAQHQHINLYKESIRSFLRTTPQRTTGIILYKNRRFTFANQAAKKIVDININTYEGHPLTRTLKNLAQQVETYKSPQTCITKDAHGNPLIISGVPHLDLYNVIITLSYPDISDIISHQIGQLKDPMEWDYLLYLETTRAGQLINQLVPGKGEALLAFKIALLKASLGKRATLLNMPDEDLLATVELLHHTSLRETLHILDLQSPSRNNDATIKLFGMSPILCSSHQEYPLLEKLSSSGTLFIKNIHFLDMDSQIHLAEFLRYGMFRMFKSDQKIPSDVRLICSSAQNLQHLVQEGSFCPTLHERLKQMNVSLPPLITLAEQELYSLADGFAEQAIKTHDFKMFLELTDKDKNRIALKRPASLHELKIKVQQALIQKSKQNHVYDDLDFDPAYDVSDPELIKAARLGKHALKDPTIMGILWHKFKNQNKIATFLGVNRSSVNRRCKEYNLLEQ